MTNRNPVRVSQILLVLAFLGSGAFLLRLILREKVPELPQESPVIVKTSGDEKQVLQFQIGSNQHFQIIVDDPQKEVAVTLRGSNRVTRSTGCVWGGVRISEATTTKATYQVELRSCDPEDHANYRIALLEVRNSTDKDVGRVEAQRASEEADHLIQVKPPDREEALRKAKMALEMWMSIGDPLEEARAFLAVGTMYQDSGKPKEALEVLEQGLRVADTAKIEIEQASIRREISAVLSGDGKIDQAMEYASQATQISMANSLDKKGVAEGWLAEGYAQYLKSRMDDAADSYKNAYDVFETLQYRRGQALALWNMAIVDLVRQRFSDAQERASQSQAIFDKLHDEVGRAKSSIVIGQVLTASTDRHQEALDLLLPARDILKNAGDLEGEAVALNSIAQVYVFLHDCETALPYMKDALDKLIRTGNKVAESVDLQFAGYCYYELGEFANARSNLERARLGFQRLQDERYEALCLTDLAMVQLAEGDNRAAESNLNTVLKMSLTRNDNRLEASVKLALGRIREESNSKAALPLYKDSLQLYGIAEHPPGEVSALYYIARYYRRIGDFDESMAYSKAAIEIIEKLRTSLASSGLQTLYFASAQQHYDLFIDSLMQIPGGMPWGPNAVKAFEWSERARARTLMDNIRQSRISISEGVDRALASRLAAIWARINSKSDELADAAPDSKQRAALNEELRTLYSEYDELQTQLRKEDPHYAAVLKPQPLTLLEIQNKVLDNQTLLLEYVLGEDCSFLFVVTDKEFSSFKLPSRSFIERKVIGLRNLMIARSVSPESPDYLARVKKADQDYPAAAADLSEILLSPVADRLANRRLAIVSDGALQYLPFAALPAPRSAAASSPTRLLLFDHEFAYLPSASTLAVIRQEAPLRTPADRVIAVFADPVYDINDERAPKAQRTFVTDPENSSVKVALSASVENTMFRSGNSLQRLPSTAKEAKAIIDLVPDSKLRMVKTGMDATLEAALNKDLRRFKYVHFATHTRLIDDHPELSSLMLSLVDEHGNHRNGSLRLQDIYNLRLSADLVVLSACETAIGKQVKGEGLMSMVRGFMYSGTPRVLASLWKVDDDGTAELMAEFYSQLLKSHSTPAKALQQAQIKLMGRKTKNQPFYWAAFQLQGEWK